MKNISAYISLVIFLFWTFPVILLAQQQSHKRIGWFCGWAEKTIDRPLSKEILFDFSSKKGGLYFVEVTSGNKRSVNKFVLNR